VARPDSVIDRDVHQLKLGVGIARHDALGVGLHSAVGANAAATTLYASASAVNALVMLMLQHFGYTVAATLWTVILLLQNSVSCVTGCASGTAVMSSRSMGGHCKGEGRRRGGQNTYIRGTIAARLFEGHNASKGGCSSIDRRNLDDSLIAAAAPQFG